MSDGETSLAATLERWRRRERIRRMWLVKNSGVSETALRRIRTGATTHPKLETVERLAIGIATDPYTLEVNQQVRADALQSTLISRPASQWLTTSPSQRPAASTSPHSSTSAEPAVSPTEPQFSTLASMVRMTERVVKPDLLAVTVTGPSCTAANVYTPVALEVVVWPVDSVTVAPAMRSVAFVPR